MRTNRLSVMALHKVVCVATLLTLLTPESQSQLDACGTAPLNTRIVGGQVAPEGSWPWQVSLQVFFTHFCGGTLINNQWVLTAAHCVSSPATENPTVILGRQSQQGSNPNRFFRSVSQTIVHPDYNPATSDNDIALLKLSSSVPFTNFIRPICLDNGQTFSVGTTCWAASWNAERGGEEQVLQEFQTSVVDCGTTTAEGSICTGAFTLEWGDSGGPLMCKQGSSWFQAAVLSFKNNSTSNSSTRQTRAEVMVFTKLSEFQSFLSQTIGTFLSPASTSGGVLTHSPSLSFSYHLLILFMCLFLFS